LTISAVLIVDIRLWSYNSQSAGSGRWVWQRWRWQQQTVEAERWQWWRVVVCQCSISSGNNFQVSEYEPLHFNTDTTARRTDGPDLATSIHMKTIFHTSI